jgi:hypothetical protein
MNISDAHALFRSVFGHAADVVPRSRFIAEGFMFMVAVDQLKLSRRELVALVRNAETDAEKAGHDLYAIPAKHR